MDIRDVARKGGQSRSEKKRQASARNLAKARATIKAALDAYNTGAEIPQTFEPERQQTPAVSGPPPSTYLCGTNWCRWIDNRMTAEYQAYNNARNRCTNPNCGENWERYGGRGIKFLFESFDQFMDAIGGPKPSPEMQLDRINNDGHYEPGNVRWATPSDNVRNSRQVLRPINVVPTLIQGSK